MGSPASSPIANLVMEHLENSVLENLKNKINIDFYQRFVDDIILSCKPSDIDIILNEFNSFHPRLKFTHEIEVDNRLNFLDMTINHNHMTGELETCWFTKQIWSQRYLNFFTHAPIENKITVVYSLVDRALLLSIKKFHSQNIIKIKKISEIK